jgi:hypothetical protein
VEVDAIASTAFVLPCVESPTDQFPVDIEKATYFWSCHQEAIGRTLDGMQHSPNIVMYVST